MKSQRLSTAAFAINARREVVGGYFDAGGARQFGLRRERHLQTPEDTMKTVQAGIRPAAMVLVGTIGFVIVLVACSDSPEQLPRSSTKRRRPRLS